MSENNWLPIHYRDFYDIPRAFVVEHEGRDYFFDCPFDDELDEYPAEYKVYRLPTAAVPTEAGQSWAHLSGVGQYLGRVATTQVPFDPSRRDAVSAKVFDLIT